MSPITHFLVGWLVANSARDLSRRERGMIVIAGVIPDVDGVGLVAEVLTKDSPDPLLWFSDYHHIVGHNIVFFALVTLASLAFAERRLRVAVLVALSFHLHMLGDILGSRGPEGYQWPIPYLLPFSNKVDLVWSGQWALNAWPNMLITAVALALTFALTRKRGFSPVGLLSPTADKRFVDTLRARFPLKDER